VIKSIKDSYNSPDSCPYLCVPLKKYTEFFADTGEGFSKVALTVAWIATGIFAYLIFGLLAVIGVAFKACRGKEEVASVNPAKAFNDEQVAKMEAFFKHLPWPDTPRLHVLGAGFWPSYSRELWSTQGSAKEGRSVIVEAKAKANGLTENGHKFTIKCIHEADDVPGAGHYGHRIVFIFQEVD